VGFDIADRFIIHLIHGDMFPRHNRVSRESRLIYYLIEVIMPLRFAIDKQYANVLMSKKYFYAKNKNKKTAVFFICFSEWFEKTLYSEEMLDGVVILDDFFD